MKNLVMRIMRIVRPQRRFWLQSLVALLLLIGGSAWGTRPRPVHAAAFDSATYAASTTKLDLYRASSGSYNTATNGVIQAYLDAAGMLHVNTDSANGQYLTVANMDTATAKQKYTNVKGIAFEGTGTIRLGANFYTSGVSTTFFNTCINLASITGLERLDVSQMTTLSDFFVNSSLRSVSGYENWNTSNVTSLASTFGGPVTAWPSVAKWDTSHVKSMAFLFDGSSTAAGKQVSGKAITISSHIEGLDQWNTSAVTSFAYAFSQTNLDTASLAEISGWDVHNGTNFNSMFYSAFNQARPSAYLAVRPDLSAWNVGNGDSFNSMFAADSAITSFADLKNWNMSKASDISSMFNGCRSLQDASFLTNWAVNDANKASFRANSFLYDTFALRTVDFSGWTISKNITTPFFGDSSIAGTDGNIGVQLTSITFGPNWSGTVNLPVYPVGPYSIGTSRMSYYAYSPQSTYPLAYWRGAKYDRAQVGGTIAQNVYQPSANASQRGDTLRMGYDVKLRLVDSQGNKVALAGQTITWGQAGATLQTVTTDANGEATVTNYADGTYQAALTSQLPAQYSPTNVQRTASLATAMLTLDGGTASPFATRTTTLAGVYAPVDLIVDPVTTTLPAAGGHTPLIEAALGVSLITASGVLLWRKRRA